MSIGSVTVLLIVVVVILIISLVYTSMASTSLSNVQYGSDTGLTQAQSYLRWASIAGWLAAIAIVIGIIYIFTEYEAIAVTGSTLLSGLLFLAIILLLIIGILASIAASRISNSSFYAGSSSGSDISNAYRYSVIAAVAAIISFFFVIGVIIAYRRVGGRSHTFTRSYIPPPRQVYPYPQIPLYNYPTGPPNVRVGPRGSDITPPHYVPYPPMVQQVRYASPPVQRPVQQVKYTGPIQSVSRPVSNSRQPGIERLASIPREALSSRTG